MAKFSLSRPETQARVSAAISLISVGGLLALGVLVLRHVDSSQWVITYGKGRGMMIQVAAAVTILLAIVGFGMGLSSAGQRRNDKPNLSWLGFFVGAGVICLSIVLLYLFKTRGELWGI